MENQRVENDHLNHTFEYKGEEDVLNLLKKWKKLNENDEKKILSKEIQFLKEKSLELDLQALISSITNLRNISNYNFTISLLQDKLLFITPSPFVNFLNWENYFKKVEITLKSIKLYKDNAYYLKQFDWKKKDIQLNSIENYFKGDIQKLRNNLQSIIEFNYLLENETNLKKYSFKREEELQQNDELKILKNSIIIPSINENPNEINLKETLNFLFFNVFHPLNEYMNQITSYKLKLLLNQINEEFPLKLYSHLKSKFKTEKEINLNSKNISILFFFSLNLCSNLFETIQQNPRIFQKFQEFYKILMERKNDIMNNLKGLVEDHLIILNQTILKSIFDLENLKNFLKKEELDENILQEGLNYILLLMSKIILTLPKKEEIDWSEYSFRILKKLKMKNGSKKYYILQICYILENLNKKIYHQMFKIEVLKELFEQISFKEFKIELGELYLKYSPTNNRRD
eukprot:gene7256-11574_t